MDANTTELIPHLAGELSLVDELSTMADTFGGRLLAASVHRAFWRLCREIGLRPHGDRTGPRVHDFRHRVAITTLVNWYRAGTSNSSFRRSLPTSATPT